MLETQNHQILKDSPLHDDALLNLTTDLAVFSPIGQPPITCAENKRAFKVSIGKDAIAF